jgi:hypothetical protein
MINEHSEDWKEVQRQVSDWLASARRQLESDGKSELEYAQLRARIKFCSEVLALPSKKPTPRVGGLGFEVGQ